MLSHARRWIIAAALSLLAGCASGPTPQEIANADYGTPIAQGQAEERIKQYFNGVLKDPYSAQYQFSQVQQGYVVGSAFEGRNLYAGYIISVDVNAKNSFGGYTGSKGYQFLFQNGALVKGMSRSANGTLFPLF
ncbi:hypothetical protein NJH54_17830 [Pseudomonas asiatica]|uniref:hypothetical protein n=1 Tax=Pseudomonas asiatica TaxID=2219225 RepID=UPI00209B538E|nr:hypothetical protein [Pseudomonas asiatica]MCO7526356.1 hypothetical protein [Pseudomonas asiatica]